MSDPTDQVLPRLAPPGAGLPKLELFVARLALRWQRRRATRESVAARFRGEREQILRLARGCDPATGSRRVLIPRPRGLEDSSRYWSVFMTLDHLRIVNEGTAKVIARLSRGKVPARATSTADVKPSPGADASAIGAFERGCDDFERGVAAVPDLRTQVCYAHPWFGPLDAAGWHFTAAFHMGLHRRQIETILRILGNALQERV